MSSAPIPDPTRQAPRIGLALSGGGFRATLFHLGVIRALRDQGLLPHVASISSVSGGSILAAHLVLQWHRYTSPRREEFDEAVEELLAFVRLGPRGRILHRLPWIGLWSVIGSLLPFVPGNRINHSTLLQHYLSRLYRDQDLGCLANTDENLRVRAGEQVGPRPDLYVLSTNLTTGGLCAFTAEGMMPSVTVGALSSTETGSRTSGGRPKDTTATGGAADLRKEDVIGIKTGMIPISMAVAASAAIPHFFPPVQVSVKPLGVDRSGVKADPQYMTDGGVIDNTGAVAYRTLYRKKPSEQVWEPVPILRPDGHQSRTHQDRADLNMILVSRAGGPLDYQPRDLRSTLSTATRSVDILMDRISRMAVDDTDPSLVTVDIQTEVEEQPELVTDVQRTLRRIRTDMDRFSKVEINALLRHGTEVARQRLAKELADPRLDVSDLEPTTDRDYRAWRDCRWNESVSIPGRVGAGLQRFGMFLFTLLTVAIVGVWRLIPLIWMWYGLQWLARGAMRTIRGIPRFFNPPDEDDGPTGLPADVPAPPNAAAATTIPPATDQPGQVQRSWHRAKAWVLDWWSTELRLKRRPPVAHLRGSHEEHLRARILMKSSRRRLLSGSSSDWLAPINILIFLTVAVLGLWNLYSYFQRPGFEVGFDDFPGERWVMEFQYQDYPALYLGSLKRVQGKDEVEQDKIIRSLYAIGEFEDEAANDADAEPGDDDPYDQLVGERLASRTARDLAHYRNYLHLKWLAHEARLRSRQAEAQDLPPWPFHTARSELRASRDRGHHLPRPFGDRWFGRGRILMPSDEQFDYTFDIEYFGDTAVANFQIPSLFQRNNPRNYKALLIRADSVQPVADGRLLLTLAAADPSGDRAEQPGADDPAGDAAGDPGTVLRDRQGLLRTYSTHFETAGEGYYVGEMLRLTDPASMNATPTPAGEEPPILLHLEGQYWQSMGARVILRRIE